MYNNPLRPVRKAIKAALAAYPIFEEAGVPDNAPVVYGVITGQTFVPALDGCLDSGTHTFLLDIVVRSGGKGATQTAADELASTCAGLLTSTQIPCEGYYDLQILNANFRQLTEHNIGSKIFRTIVTFTHLIQRKNGI